MRIFSIGDVHLSFVKPVDTEHWDSVEASKPMDVFSEVWREHYRKLFYNWVDLVSDKDIVLLTGDISWAMRLGEARHDLDFLGLLPGTIVCIQGNHDYWWQSVSKVRAALPPNMRVIQNDHFSIGSLAICGTRGWYCPGAEVFRQEDLKVYRRELARMENSLKSASPETQDIIVMTHFMPTNDRHEKNEFIEMFQRYGVSAVIYSHLHGESTRLRLPDFAWGINFYLTSADYLNFTPAVILENISMI